MTANRLIATRAYSAISGPVIALSTKSDLRNAYAEVQVSFASAVGFAVGVANRFINTSGALGSDSNGIGLAPGGAVTTSNIQIGTGPTYVSGNVIAIAVNAAAGTIQFRNVTTSSAWFGPFPLAGLGPTCPPYFLASSLVTVGDFAAANFYGPFQGTVPAGFLNWNPEALFSEQPVKVLDFEAVIADGNYSSTNVNDLVAMPFSFIRWGDANLNAANNLRFTDWVMQEDPDQGDEDWPLLSITETPTTVPADNYIWGSWDGGPNFLIIRFRFTVTGDVNISNIPVPPPTAPAPNVGEGHVLALFISCDTTANFTWKNGRIFGTENVLVWAPIEYATFPPSVPGIVEPRIPANVIQGGHWGPPIGPPL
jgi:hypothetical protein